MKYDFSLDLVNDNSLTIIIEQIKKNSVVLEFGPANGRLTKYLKENLNCKVYLVEIDEEAGKEALQYGEDIVIGDAEAYEWLERYRDIRFDYLVFADVLEHLRNPEELLVQAKHLLKPDGTILLSVPNLAHNSVLIDLFNNKFEYNSIGLLDNTHIHMFTKQSLENMLMRAGLVVESRNATYSRVGACEIVNSVDDVAYMDKSYWNTREYGEVYQFVYSAKKGREHIVQEVNELPKYSLNYFVQLYKGESWEDENSTRKYVQNIHGVNVFRFYNIENEKRLRLDPLNGACIIEIQNLFAKTQDGNFEVLVKESNAILANKGVYVFYTDDPILELEIQCDKEIEYLEIVINYISLDAKQIKCILESVKNTAYIFASKEEFESDEYQNERLNIKKYYIDQQVCALQEKIKDLEEQLSKVQGDLSVLRDDKSKIEAAYEQLKFAYEEKDQVLEGIYRSRSWRYTKLFRRS